MDDTLISPSPGDNDRSADAADSLALREADIEPAPGETSSKSCPVNPTWTPEKTELLRKMWQAGDSASTIAKALGDVTRNAVIGKAHRLGLSPRPSPLILNGKRKDSDVRTAAAAADDRQRDRWGDPRNCRWPIGDPREPDFHFCNAPYDAAQGHGRGSYCSRHAAIAYGRDPGTASAQRMNDGQAGKR